MLIKSESSKTSVSLYTQAKQLEKEAKEISDDIFKGMFDRHKIAILMKRYAELYTELERNERYTYTSN